MIGTKDLKLPPSPCAILLQSSTAVPESRPRSESTYNPEKWVSGRRKTRLLGATYSSTQLLGVLPDSGHKRFEPIRATADEGVQRGDGSLDFVPGILALY